MTCPPTHHETTHSVYSTATGKFQLYCHCGTATHLLVESEEVARRMATREGWRYYVGSSLDEWYARPRPVGFDYGD